MHVVAVNALGEYQIPSNMKKRTICSVVGFYTFLLIRELFWGLGWEKIPFLLTKKSRNSDGNH